MTNRDRSFCTATVTARGANCDGIGRKQDTTSWALTFAVSADRLPPRPRNPAGATCSPGIASPETSILRGAVCDYLRTMQIARDLFKGRTTRA